MSKPLVCVVVPTARPEMMDGFTAVWDDLFCRHNVVLVVVYDDAVRPAIAATTYGDHAGRPFPDPPTYDAYRHLIYRRTDSVRNLGFLYAARLRADYVLTLDDDVAPIGDPIADHLGVMGKRVSTSWMNTAQCDLRLRGVPYSVRGEATVHVSHGVWEGTPDFDGLTQLALERGAGVPRTLPYYEGPVPAAVRFPVCGMNLMVSREALPFAYFAPMGPDTGLNLHRFGDIWMGVEMQGRLRHAGGAIYTAAARVMHTRASDALKNAQAEELGAAWNEMLYGRDRSRWPDALVTYRDAWTRKRLLFKSEIRRLYEDHPYAVEG